MLKKDLDFAIKVGDRIDGVKIDHLVGKDSRHNGIQHELAVIYQQTVAIVYVTPPMRLVTDNHGHSYPDRTIDLFIETTMRDGLPPYCRVTFDDVRFIGLDLVPPCH